MRIDQYVPTFEPGAVGAHSLHARDILRAAGHTSEIYAAEIRDVWKHHGARPLSDARDKADVIVYQMAIGSVTGDAVMKRSEPLVVDYHNFTPYRYFNGWDPIAAQGVAWGVHQLHELATRTALGIGDSSYNELDLRDAGYERTMVVPILLDVGSLASGGSRTPGERPTTWLFVGRVAPNKAQHDLVKAFEAYRRFHEADARLVIVGGGLDGLYGRALKRFVHALGLDDAVTLTGGVSDADLAQHYADADVFVVVSEHEGFCVPLLEAMRNRLPIVAHAAAAIPETLGDAGMLLHSKDPCTVAAAVARVVGDEQLRTQLVTAGDRRVEEFDVSRTGPLFVDAVTSVAR